MSNYWIGDSVGRVLGPLTLESLRELIRSGRLKAVTQASRDGTSWEPIAQFAEVKDLLSAAQPQRAVQQQQAERLRQQWQQMQEMTTHQLFGVKPQTTLEELRGAFFRLARGHAPEQHAGVAPELRKVHADIFELLARRMREAEAQHLATRGQAPAAPGGRTLTPVGTRAAQPQPPAYTYSAEEFVGLNTHNERLQVEIRVSARNTGIFTDHRIINVHSGGLFLPTARPLKLGTPVDVVLHFDAPSRQLKLRSSVIWEYTQNDGKQPRGYGLGLADLRTEERAFVEEYLRNHRPAQPTPAG